MSIRSNNQNVNSINESYVNELEEMIATVLGEMNVTQIAELAGCSEEQAQEYTTLKDMAKLSHLIKSRNDGVENNVIERVALSH